MAQFRVTKYNPRYRDASGAYRPDEWTSISEIGRNFDGVVFTGTDYVRAEKQYVAVADRFLSLLRVETLTVVGLEARLGGSIADLVSVGRRFLALTSIEEGARLRKQEALVCMRYILRELLWCKLVGDDGVFFHFGYDYYMYLGCDADVSKDQLEMPGMFIEPFQSPYFYDDED
ncbi:hypothetical protein [Acanthopleuribacter pedis]|uniref:Uncharacterized protein n=1 Tax=Acanthopleuribacter pedis TaxID=442870 RepID=A0A8J7Q8U1_9BACT|nr:hypothetical protein [Acanthopleuribacter pedis]MBO1320671.1 hypothetical protein [Acanthopleuribacter pedis]